MTLFDHFVGELQEMLGNVEAKRFCGLEVDDKLKLDWRLCGECGRVLALQDTVGSVQDSVLLCFFRA
jgi:hypothetical protein